jgi:hypothetical protein
MVPPCTGRASAHWAAAARGSPALTPLPTHLIPSLPGQDGGPGVVGTRGPRSSPALTPPRPAGPAVLRTDKGPAWVGLRITGVLEGRGGGVEGAWRGGGVAGGDTHFLPPPPPAPRSPASATTGYEPQGGGSPRWRSGCRRRGRSSRATWAGGGDPRHPPSPRCHLG